jgi:hypothetical protein
LRKNERKERRAKFACAWGSILHIYQSDLLVSLHFAHFLASLEGIRPTPHKANGAGTAALAQHFPPRPEGLFALVNLLTFIILACMHCFVVKAVTLEYFVFNLCLVERSAIRN